MLNMWHNTEKNCKNGLFYFFKTYTCTSSGIATKIVYESNMFIKQFKRLDWSFGNVFTSDAYKIKQKQQIKLFINRLDNMLLHVNEAILKFGHLGSTPHKCPWTWLHKALLRSVDPYVLFQYNVYCFKTILIRVLLHYLKNALYIASYFQFSS